MTLNNNKILINLSFVSTQQPSGLVRYTNSILPYFPIANSTCLANLDVERTLLKKSGLSVLSVPDNLTVNHGKNGHIKRLLWLQSRLPEVYKQQQATLFFSPIPESSLYTSCRQIVTIHDFIPRRFPRWRSPLYFYHRFYIPAVANQADHIICNSEATAKDIVDFCGVTAKKVTPILLGYDQSHFQPCITEDNHNNPYFLYLGRHDPHKNIHRIIRAFHAGKFAAEIQLWLVGAEHPKYTPGLKQLVRELGLDTRVKFLDYVVYQELPKIISGAIALVFPSLWEGFGLPILEAMGCGTPVITSQLASMPEVAGDAAILVDPYNTNDILAGMKAIANDSALRAKLSTLSLARAQQFSWEKTGRETIEVLEHFL